MYYPNFAPNLLMYDGPFFIRKWIFVVCLFHNIWNM